MNDDSPMTYVRIGTVLLSAAVLQATLIADVRVLDVSIDLLLLLSIAAGLTGGSDRGAIVGFVAGLAMDLLLETPFGLSALAYCLTGYLVGTLSESVERGAWWVPLPAALGAGALGVGIFVAAGDLVGASLTSVPDLGKIVIVVAASCAVLILPANRLVRWCFAGPADSRPRDHLMGSA
jgi:rod shape-determining protein MreD